MKLTDLVEKKDPEDSKGTYAGFRYDKDGVALLSKYAKDNDLPNQFDPKKLHTTLLYSRKHLPDYEPVGKIDPPYTAKIGKMESWKTQSGATALVINLTCPKMNKRHETLMKEHGATYDFDEYKPHITLSYDVGDLDVDKLPDIRDTIKEMSAVEEYGDDLKLDWADEET